MAACSCARLLRFGGLLFLRPWFAAAAFFLSLMEVPIPGPLSRSVLWKSVANGSLDEAAIPPDEFAALARPDEKGSHLTGCAESRLPAIKPPL